MGFLEQLLFQNYIFPIAGWVSIGLIFYWSNKASASKVFHDLNDAGVHTRLAFVIFTSIVIVWNIAQPLFINWHHDNAYRLVPDIFPYLIIGGILFVVTVVAYALIHKIIRWVVWNGTAELHYSIFEDYDKVALSKKINHAVKESTEPAMFERIRKIEENSESVIEFWQKIQKDPYINSWKLYRKIPSIYDTSKMSQYELIKMLDLNQKYNYSEQK